MKKSSDLCNHKESIHAILHSLEKGIYWLCKFSVIVYESSFILKSIEKVGGETSKELLRFDFMLWLFLNFYQSGLLLI